MLHGVAEELLSKIEGAMLFLCWAVSGVLVVMAGVMAGGHAQISNWYER